jgi:dCMP deaminase
MKQRDKTLYMDIVHRVAKQSYAIRLKVGGVLVTSSGMLSIGYNGTPAGWDNACEDKVYWNADNELSTSENVRDDYLFSDEKGWYKLVTKPEVSHAEENVISKMLEEGVPAKGASVFLTHSPCIHCAKILANAKIKELYYAEAYRSNDGIEYLRKAGIYVEQISREVCNHQN